MPVTTKPRISYREMRTNAEKIADEIIKQHVLAGIDLLNREYGPDWVDEIDPARLVLSEGNSCVLGQVYGDYAGGLEKLGMGRYAYHSGTQFGFYIDDDSEEQTEWQKLDDAWLISLGIEPRYGFWS